MMDISTANVLACQICRIFAHYLVRGIPIKSIALSSPTIQAGGFHIKIIGILSYIGICG